MTKQRSLFKNTLILGFGRVASQSVAFLLLPLYTLYLSPDEYGFVDLVVVYVSLLIPSLTLQLEMASFRYLIDTRNNTAQQAKVISNILQLALMLSTPWIAVFIIVGAAFEIPHMWYILATGIAMLCSRLALQITRGLGNNKEFALSSVLVGLLTLVGAVIFMAYLNMRIEGMLLSIIVANLGATIYIVARLKLYRYIHLGQRDNLLRREILGYSVPLVPNGVAWWGIVSSDRAIISTMISVTANGIYAVSTKFSAILNNLFGVFSMSWAESASLHINAPDRDKFFSDVASSSVRLFGSIGIGLISLTPFIFPVMVSSEFNEAYKYIPIMVAGVFFNSIVGVYSAVYIAKKLTKQVMNTSLASALINIILTLGLIPLFELYAAAVSTSIAFLVMAVFRHYDVKKYVKITYENKIFLALATLYIVVVYLYYINTLWTSITGLLIAITSGYLINRNDLSKALSMATHKLRTKSKKPQANQPGQK